MANRIYTKTGDKGSTSLLGGTRVSKNDARLEAAGNIDELSSAIGFIRYQTEQDDQLKQIQIHLFHIGALLGTDPEQFDISKLKQITEEDVKLLEAWIDEMEVQLEPLKNFILPTGIVHLSRAICRRAERNLVKLTKDRDVSLELRYLNRLSDYLFVLGRHLNYVLETDEVIWKAAQE